MSTVSIPSPNNSNLTATQRYHQTRRKQCRLQSQRSRGSTSTSLARNALVKQPSSTSSRNTSAKPPRLKIVHPSSGKWQGLFSSSTVSPPATSLHRKRDVYSFNN